MDAVDSGALMATITPSGSIHTASMMPLYAARNTNGLSLNIVSPYYQGVFKNSFFAET